MSFKVKVKNELIKRHKTTHFFFPVAKTTDGEMASVDIGGYNVLL